jgi:hypothetical protein
MLTYADVCDAIVFAYLACASTIAALLLLLADAREGGWLNASAAALQVH